ncbi:MAG: PHP domain-containing protein [Nitrospirae bacterium]|nr:MAG: PHP domain-containing protein [Nitrospirota bacterium]
MSFRVDLHVHSRFSSDNDADPEESVLQAISRQLHGIVFTEHYSYEASAPVEKLREKYRGSIIIFRGVEFSSADGHCLVFGVNTDRLGMKGMPAGEIVRIVNQAGGVVIPSHPYRTVNSLGDLVRNLPGICALEGYNGCNMQPFNARAVEVARALNLPFTGGSDAHNPEDVGSCFTEFEEPVTEENLVSLLKSGRYRGVDTRKISKGFWG